MTRNHKPKITNTQIWSNFIIQQHRGNSTKQALTKHYMINQNSRTKTALSHHIETKHQGKKRLSHIDTNITRKSKLFNSRKQRTLSYHTEPKNQDKKRLSQIDTNITNY